MEIEEVLKFKDKFKDKSFIKLLIKDENMMYTSHNNGSNRDLTRSEISGLYDALMNNKRNGKSFFWLMNMTMFHTILILYSQQKFMPLSTKNDIFYFMGSPVIFGPVSERIYLLNVFDIHEGLSIDNSPVFAVIKDLWSMYD